MHLSFVTIQGVSVSSACVIKADDPSCHHLYNNAVNLPCAFCIFRNIVILLGARMDSV